MTVLFGVASAAMQIEGAADSAGRTASIWDVFATLPGRIEDGSSPARTAEHHARWSTDLDLLAALGVDAYRLSLSWSRVQPGGTGPVNAAGLDFYDALVDGLLARGIEPWVSLYRWDLPLELMLEGGWLLRDTAERFGDYAAAVAARLGDRVGAWASLEEPFPHLALGHAVGVDAPGLTLLGGAFPVTHHLLLGHARATAALRAAGAGRVGLINHHTTVRPAGPSGRDRWAAAFYDEYHNRQFADPVLLGRYPDRLLALPGVPDGVIADGDLAAIAAPLDFYGVSYEHPVVVAAVPENRSVPLTLVPLEGVPRTAGDLPIDPPALEQVLVDLARRYPHLPPVVVTTGGAFDDRPDGDDRPRIAFLDEHLAAVDRAAGRGVPVAGYFHWSLLDGWAGTPGHVRTGLVRVDPDTLERTPRAAFAHYRDLIAHRSGDTSVTAPADRPARS